jgi:hypothetical protein
MLLLKLLVGGLVLALLTWMAVLFCRVFGEAEQVSSELQELQDALEQAFKERSRLNGN